MNLFPNLKTYGTIPSLTVKSNTGTYLSDGSCLSCFNPCEECYSNGTCIECEDWYKVEDGECVASCLGEDCVSFETGFYLTNLYQCLNVAKVTRKRA